MFTDFGTDRSKYIILSQWKEETLALQRRRIETLRGNKFEMSGIWKDNKGKKVFSFQFSVHKLELLGQKEREKLVSKQVDSKSPLVGKIQWFLLKDKDQILIDLKGEETGIG